MFCRKTKQDRFISYDVTLCRLLIICHISFMDVAENRIRLIALDIATVKQQPTQSECLH